MEIGKKTGITAILLVAWLSVSLLLQASAAQEPSEAAYVRGHISDGDGVWRADDFGFFYYDLDSGQGGEELRIDMDGRLAREGSIVYTSSAWWRQFEYRPWGRYQAVAFFGRLYLAGYPEGPLTDKASSLGEGELRRVLLDESETYTLTYDRPLPLQDGYVLALKEVSERNDLANFVLLRDSEVVDSAVVDIGGTYVYRVDDIPVLLVHMSAAMRGEGSGFAEVDGIFQVSDEPDVRLFEGGRIGNLELSDLSTDGFSFRSYRGLTFGRNTVVPLTGEMAIVVIDAPDLYYYPEGGFFSYGVYEIRGPAFSDSSAIPVMLGSYNSSAMARWNAGNYTGFYFDPEQGIGTETLVLYGAEGRRVPPPSRPRIDAANRTALQDGMQYTSFVQPKEFEYEPWGHYFVISFLGNQWFAGYDSSLEGRSATKSLLEQEDLGLVLMDREPQGIAVAGNYSLAEGYELRIRDVGNDSLFLQLYKDGVQVDSSAVRSNSTYIYKKDLGDVEEMPIIMAHIGNVFNDGLQRFAVIDGLFQISDQYILPVEPGLGLGKMEIVSVQPGLILMVNNEEVNLNRDSRVALLPGMNIRVADNDTLRYYIYTSQYVVPRPRPPQIRTPENVTPRVDANFSMVVRAAEIRQVTTEILGQEDMTVFSKDITGLASGSGDLWSFSWSWNGTTLRLSDDSSPVIDAEGGLVPGMLFLDPATPPLQVGVRFGQDGRIASISDSRSVYYISRGEYSSLKPKMSYDDLLANATARAQIIRVQPGRSILQLYNVVDGRLVPSGINHTLQGTLEALEPHAERTEAPPGRYELRLRIENAVDAIQVFGEHFNVTDDVISGVVLGSGEVAAGGSVSIPLLVPDHKDELSVEISFDPELLRAVRISGTCSPSWNIDPRAGRAKILLPAGCNRSNLTFEAGPAISENLTAEVRVTGVQGFDPEYVRNGTVTIHPSRGASAPGALTAILALLAAAILWGRVAWR